MVSIIYPAEKNLIYLKQEVFWYFLILSSLPYPGQY